jgi:hypothetical protein
MRILLVVVATSACVPTPPFHTFETADALAANHVAVTVGGGGGGNNGGTCCSGGGARLRVGVGGGQEIGVDATALTDGNTYDIGTKLAYKRQVAPNVAIVAGAGATFGRVNTYGTTIGGDVGAVASMSGPKIQPYAALRIAVAKHLQSSDPQAVEAAIAAVGVAVPAGAFRFFFELGGVVALQQSHDSFSDPTTPTNTHDTEGYYGAAGIAYTFR